MFLILEIIRECYDQHSIKSRLFNGFFNEIIKIMVYYNLKLKKTIEFIIFNHGFFCCVNIF